MNITFILPDAGNKPVGGYKVVYEYAKKMDADGNRVTIVYSNSVSVVNRMSEKIGAFKKYAKKRLFHAYSCKPWFDLPPSIKELLVPDMRACNVPDADIVFATSWETAGFVADYPISKGKKYYLIQHFEDWSGDKDRVSATFKMDLHKIVIASWLAEKVHALGEACSLIENGLDFTYFCLSTPISDKDKYSVSMLYHAASWKGSEYGIQALKDVKNSIPQLRAKLFGVPGRPENLPDWIEYYQKPDKGIHNRIYDESAIFLAPSLTEGFGLTPAEAMMCGCAVACADNGGHRVFAEDNVTALLSTPGDYKALSRNLVRLINDDELRVRLANEGNKRIREFTWDRAYSKMKALIGC